VTIFLSTHSLAVAEGVCGRIGIIDRGQLVALGSLDELRARAKTAAGAEQDGPHARGRLPRHPARAGGRPLVTVAALLRPRVLAARNVTARHPRRIAGLALAGRRALGRLPRRSPCT
jgi:ABC-type glutathione transport system ATPase component